MEARTVVINFSVQEEKMCVSLEPDETAEMWKREDKGERNNRHHNNNKIKQDIMRMCESTVNWERRNKTE